MEVRCPGSEGVRTGGTRLVGFCSPIYRCGKDSAADVAVGMGLGIVKVALADALRRFVAARHGFPESKFAEAKAAGGLAAFFGRLVLVHVGTDQFRVQDEDVWVDKLDAHLARHPEVAAAAVPDVRFPNEARRIVDRGGLLVGVRRRLAEETNESKHASESHYDHMREIAQAVGLWAEVHNEGTLIDLRAAVEPVVARWWTEGRP